MKHELRRVGSLIDLVLVVLASGALCFGQAPSAESEGPSAEVVWALHDPPVEDVEHVKPEPLKFEPTRFVGVEKKREWAPDPKFGKGLLGDEDDPVDPSAKPEKEKFHWGPAMRESLLFLGIQHAMRLQQEKTTRQLGGPFFRDWARSVKQLRGWRDGDIPFINYVAHPMQGSLTGRVFVNNSDNAKRQEFGMSSGYWKSRAKALLWSAAWSTQFEIGPISEASIGNVGFPRKDGSRSTGYVDYVITPAVGTGVLVGEDAIDKYILKGWIEKKAGGKLTTRVKVFRSLFTPTTSFANLLRGKYPWKRDDR
jgi:hypothetical protein